MFGRAQRKLLDDGQPMQAVVVGLRRRREGELGERYDLGLLLPDGARLGVRQSGLPTAVVRLGAQVLVRSDGRAAIIDVAGARDADWKALREPPADGIDDAFITAHKGERLLVQLASIEATTVLGRPTPYRELTLVEPGGHIHNLSRQDVPLYARHIAVPGALLPAVRHKGRLTIDWPAASAAATRE